VSKKEAVPLGDPAEHTDKDQKQTISWGIYMGKYLIKALAN